MENDYRTILMETEFQNLFMGVLHPKPLFMETLFPKLFL